MPGSRCCRAASARARWRSAATARRSPRLDQPHDATFKLERNTYNGAVEPRLVLRQAQRCAPAPIERWMRDRAGVGYLAAVLAELERRRAARTGARAPTHDRAASATGAGDTGPTGSCSTAAARARWRC